MSNLRWLKLNGLKLSSFPEFTGMDNLEYLSLTDNCMAELDDSTIESITTLNLRRNMFGVKPECLDCNHLPYTLTLDMSHNKLYEFPRNITALNNLVTLNLAFNNICLIPDDLFTSCSKLVFLDLSHNLIEVIPDSISSCHFLQILNLGHNPIQQFSPSNLSGLVHLRSLNLSNTKVTDTLPLDFLTGYKSITELDLSLNQLTLIPSSVLLLTTLTRFNISNNCIKEISNDIQLLKSLRFLNVSFNQISCIPESISHLTELKRFYINGNLLKSSGIPQSIGCLENLEIFMAAFNELETIPPALCRCHKLSKLILRNNKLLTLPQTIYNLVHLQTLDVKGNPQLVMPKKFDPNATGDVYSRMDFSYDNVRNMVFALIKQQLPTIDVTKEHLQKQKLHVHKKTKIEKLDEIASAEARKANKKSSVSEEYEPVGESLFIRKKNLLETYRAYQVDSSDLFPENTGCSEGVTIFQIENFLPTPYSNVGCFYDGDCYIILNTVKVESALKHTIYFWIGNESKIDKKACSAMHAVNLRNLLGSEDKTQREEQGEESDEFKKLFPFEIVYKNGHGSATSFSTFDEKKNPKILFYRMITDAQNKAIIAQKALPSSSSLDPNFVFLAILESKIFVWFGDKSKSTMRNKARLFAVKLNKVEKKGLAQIIVVNEDEENSSEFWDALGMAEPYNGNETTAASSTAITTTSRDYGEKHLSNPILYFLNVGPGYLELPQVALPNGVLKPSVLCSDSVYILDCWDEVYIWTGKNTTSITKEAAKRLAIQILKFFTRPAHAEIEIVKEGFEGMIFKSKFGDWNDVLTVDYTRSATSVADSRKAPPSTSNLSKKVGGESASASDGKPKILTHADFNLPQLDVASIFLPRQPDISDDCCESIIQTVEEDLDKMDCFVFESKNFTKLPNAEFGHFYSEDCYVFLCRNIIVVEDPLFGDDDTTIDGRLSTSGDDEAEREQKTEVRYTVYFWEGRSCPRAGYLNFAFSLRKKFEELFGDKLTIERIRQQQEPFKFLALFNGKFVIHRGKRCTGVGSKSTVELQACTTPRLYQSRCMMGLITRRCVEIDLDAQLLCSHLCYICMSPTPSPVSEKECPDDHSVEGTTVTSRSTSSESEERDAPGGACSSLSSSSTLYLWIGKNASETERLAAENIATFLADSRPFFTRETIEEGNEPQAFWQAIGGQRSYLQDSLFLTCSRLFRCSNESGYFGVKEKCADFCQDDLVDDDVMMLDDGSTIFLWIGPTAATMEKVLSLKIAPIYAEHCRLTKFGTTRSIKVILKGSEPVTFRRAFQGFISTQPSPP